MELMWKHSAGKTAIKMRFLWWPNRAFTLLSPSSGPWTPSSPQQQHESFYVDECVCVWRFHWGTGTTSESVGCRVVECEIEFLWGTKKDIPMQLVAKLFLTAQGKTNDLLKFWFTPRGIKHESKHPLTGLLFYRTITGYCALFWWSQWHPQTNC